MNELLVGINYHADKAVVEVRMMLSAMALVPNVPTADLHGVVEIIGKLERIIGQSKGAIAHTDMLQFQENIGNSDANSSIG